MSGFFDIYQIIGLIELLIAAFFAFILSLNTLKKYRQTKATGTIIFSLNFFLTGFTLICITINRILLNEIILDIIYSTLPGLIFHNIAVILSFGVVVLLDSFAFQMTYSKYTKILTIIVSIILGILAIILLFNQPTIGISGEMVYPDELILLILPFLLPPIFIPIVVFAYYSITIKKYSKAKSLRALVMTIAIIVISISYLLELIGIIGIVVVFVRLGFVVYVLLMYIAFTMPQWFKNMIKWDQTQN